MYCHKSVDNGIVNVSLKAYIQPSCEMSKSDSAVVRVAGWFAYTLHSLPLQKYDNASKRNDTFMEKYWKKWKRGPNST